MCDHEEISSVFPELLSEEQLKSMFQKRWPKLKIINRLSFDELVGYYRRMLLPMPQRKYTSTYRGQLLHKRRLRCGLETSSSTQSSSKNDDVANKRKLEEDRLKLRSDGSNTTKLLLGNMKSTDKMNTTNYERNKIVINNRSTSISDSKSEPHKRPKENETRHSSEGNDENPSKSKRVKITWP